MSKPQWWRKLQYHRRQRRRITSGLIYHKHCNQVIVSKQELYIQLKESWFNKNLLACLAFGPDHPQYAYWLLMASINFGLSAAFPIRSAAAVRKHMLPGERQLKGENTVPGFLLLEESQRMNIMFPSRHARIMNENCLTTF